MQVRIEDVSPVEKKLIVEVPWDTVSSRLGDAYRELSKSVQLKGFRKGKVPRTVLQRMFGKRVKAEVATQLVRESFISATTEHNLQVVSEPRVDQELDIKKGEPFAFEAIVEVRGDVEAKDYTGMEISRRPVDVPESAVDAALEQLRKENTELLPIEGRDVTARGDVLSVAIKGNLGEHEIDRPNVPIDLDNQVQEPIPGLVEALTNLPIDVVDHEIELAIPEGHHDPSIAGKTAKMTVSIIDARRKEVPELDDELAKDSGRAENLEELRKVTRAELETQQEEQIQRELHDAALKELVKRNPIPIAESLVERGIEMEFSRLKMMLGMPAPQPGEVDPMPLDDSMREKMRSSAEEQVRGQLLLEAIGDSEKIEVTEADISEHLAKLAAMRNMPPARLRAEYDRDDKLEGVRFQLRQEKTLDLLVSKAIVTETALSAEAEAEAAEPAAAEVGETTESGEETPAAAAPGEEAD